ncbi:DNA polymerase III subunit beta [Clostridium paraputrificum]|nr:DNA polymerase III subunit beta [Clostridium paraputrificum]
MDVSIQTTVNANIIEPGSIVIDAKIFGEIRFQLIKIY